MGHMTILLLVILVLASPAQSGGGGCKKKLKKCQADLKSCPITTGNKCYKPMKYTSWADGEPTKGEACASIDPTMNLNWNNMPCNGLVRYICEKTQGCENSPHFNKKFKQTGSCYYFSKEQLLWEDAKGLCCSMDSNLVAIETEAEQNFLVKQIKKINIEFDQKYFWIGGTEKLGKWVWAEKDFTCPSGFVQYGCSCYKFVYNKQESWDGSLGLCHGWHSELVTIESAEEHRYLVDKIRADNKEALNFWTGGTDLLSEGNFIWQSNSEPFTYVKWATTNNQPDNHLDNEDCVMLWNIGPHDFNDALCSWENAFICEMPGQCQE